VHSNEVIEASAPARIDLAGGTLDLWPLHVLHPGSVTVNVAISLRAACRVGPGKDRFRVASRASDFEMAAAGPAELLAEPRAALVGSLLEALEIREPLDIEFWSDVPFGSGLGGSSALTVALMGALGRVSPRDLSGVDRVDFVRDVETRVLGKPAGVQDYYPPLEGGAHVITFRAGRTTAQRFPVDAGTWEKHLTLFDSGISHSSGMNNWEILRARLEGDPAVAENLEGVRRAAVVMAAAVERLDFARMGQALESEWAARRRLAPVVSTPLIERVFLSPEERTAAVRRALAGLGQGRLVPVQVVGEGLRVKETR
jgi:D-glycero-alpha-D-manno-heptose-7-phosphate kinase